MDHVVVIWTPPCRIWCPAWNTFIYSIKGFVIFPVSRHPMFPDTFCIRNPFKKSFCSRDFFSFLLFLDTFYVLKSVWKTGKSQILWKSNFSRKFAFLLLLDTFCIQKCLETGEMIPWKSYYFQRIFQYWTFGLLLDQVPSELRSVPSRRTLV